MPRPPSASLRPSGAAVDLLRPWRDASTWWCLVLLVTDLVAGAVGFAAMVALGATSLALLIVLPLALPVIWATFAVSRLLARLQRIRLAALVDVALVDPVPPLQARRWWSRLGERVRSRPRWKEIGYHLLALPLALVVSSAVVLLWSGSLALLALPAYVGALPDGVARFGLFELGPGPGALGAALVGAVGLALVAPWATRAGAAVAVWVAGALLGRGRQRDLEATVTRLEGSRVAAVGSAEAERRRIERDLHDGAQQRLVALAMELGVARQQLETDPEGGRARVASAHEEAKAALAELRDLVRGIHPVILEDRGLDAALSAVVARSPVPVRLHIDVGERPAPAVESTTYFVVSEALANVARHSSATRATVSIVRRGATLVVEVTDDGVGGADASRGTGLAGLAGRVRAHDGWMQVLSPVGGPTTVLVELPCAS